MKNKAVSHNSAGLTYLAYRYK